MMEPHPIALKIPPMSPEEYVPFREDIANKGLLSPITLFEGKILDGRNRHQVCLDIGLEPVYEEYTGDDPLGFVLSKNLHRRNLTAQQRRELVKEYVRKNFDKSDRSIARETRASHHTIATVRTEIAEEIPEDANEAACPLASSIDEPRERQASATSDELPPEAAEPPARVERGLKKDGTPRQARGRKPGTAAAPREPAKPKPLVNAEDQWVVDTIKQLNRDVDEVLHAFVAIIGDHTHQIEAKITEQKRRFLVGQFAQALGLKLADA